MFSITMITFSPLIFKFYKISCTADLKSFRGRGKIKVLGEAYTCLQITYRFLSAFSRRQLFILC